MSSPCKSTGQNRHQQKLFETSSRIRRGQWVWWVGLCYYTAGQELSPFLHQFLNLSQVSNGFWSCHAGRPNWKAGFWPLSLSRQTLYLTKTKLTIQQTLSPWRWTLMFNLKTILIRRNTSALFIENAFLKPSALKYPLLSNLRLATNTFLENSLFCVIFPTNGKLQRGRPTYTVAVLPLTRDGLQDS